MNRITIIYAHKQSNLYLSIQLKAKILETEKILY